MAPNWKQFWSAQSDPRHPHDNPNFYVEHGKELALVAGDPSGLRVLEFGCGSGALFKPMALDRARSYRGVDFSEQMIGEFRKAEPSVDVVCADASQYRDKQSYDLILSNAVVQYFDRTMFLRHIENARAMLAPGGNVVVGSVMWRGAQYAFYMNAYFPQARQQPLVSLARYARSLVSIRQIGRWYSLGEVEAAARRNGMTAAFFGSIQYPYRFHARLTPVP